jgi:phospholipase D1/2
VVGRVFTGPLACIALPARSTTSSSCPSSVLSIANRQAFPAPMLSDIVEQAGSNLPRDHIPTSAKKKPDLTALFQASSLRGQPSTPSTRTGPPRSFSYGYSVPNSPVTPQTSRHNSKFGPNDTMITDVPEDDGEFHSNSGSEFRSALEIASSELADRKGKKRESSLWDDGWNINPMKWFHESPKEEKTQFNFDEKDGDKSDSNSRKPTTDDAERVKSSPRSDGLKRSHSSPHSQGDTSKTSPTVRWGRLRSLIPNVTSQSSRMSVGPSMVTPQAVNITDELLAGGLSTLMLRLWFERDEKDRRRIPVLLHRLRIRVSDSLHPLHGHKSVFRIECEYGNGVARWVIYRQLRDFISLHTHYTISKAYNRNSDTLPEFPRTSMFSLEQIPQIFV